MSWCPGCSFEYNAKKKTCPECGYILLKGPGFNKPVEFMDREWFSIRSVVDPDIAERLREFLESNGYDVAIRNGNSKPKIKSGKNGEASAMLVLVPADIAGKAARFIRADNSWASENMPIPGLDDIDPYLAEDDDDCFFEDESAYLETRVDFEMMDNCDDIY